MRAALARRTWDLVLSDWTMPSFNGGAALDVLNAEGVTAPFIIVSGTVTEELAIGAMRKGARDWVPKGKLGRLLPVVERELSESDERRRAAEALRQSEEALRHAQKLDAIGGLAAGVAHDFNNVLSVIISHADLVLRDQAVSTDSRESVEEIRAAARRAADLTRQLLAFSRQQILQPQHADLSQIVAGVAKMLRRLIGEDLELQLSLAPNLDTVLVDPGQIEQVIVNLVVNARDAMPDGGTVTIETSNVYLGKSAAEAVGVEPGPYATLVVSDDGIGMDAATRARIFEPFFTTKEPGKGTGLGLATVFGIVKQSGGAVTAQSAVGRGATFRTYFPRVAAPSRPADRDERHGFQAAPRGHETLLLVEDDDTVRETLALILERQGYRVLTAPNGRAALIVCETHRNPIDLVITDVVMPQMGGRELVRRLEAVRPGVPVLYMSGYTDDAIVKHGVLRCELDFLQKPVVPEVFLEKVDEVLSRKGDERS
jgi:signal transduction histidine kinase/ActR/RegA family two-component response regulator